MWGMTDKKPSVRLALLPLLSVIGAGCAIYLTRLYYGIRSGTGGFQSLCNINSTLNCDAVTSSKYAEVWTGLPLSSFVAGWFFAILILSLIARVTEWRREAVTLGFLMSAFASLYSIALLVVMGILGKICLFCLAIDAVNFALLAIFFSLLTGNTIGIFTGIRWSKLQSYAALAAGTVFVVVVILRPSEENLRKQPTSAEIEFTAKEILASTPVDIKVPATAAVLGNPSAPITILEFSDFQCPYCKVGALLMNQLLARHEGKIRVVFMPFPLDSACNRLITRSMHPFACELARTAFCAGQEGKFQPVYEKIFEAQEDLKADSGKKIAAANGIPEAKLAECVNSEAAKKSVADSIEEGIKAKVESTPTFFINGKKVEGTLPIEVWDQLITGMIAGQSK